MSRPTIPACLALKPRLAAMEWNCEQHNIYLEKQKENSAGGPARSRLTN
jgi:hypothetical protein